MTTTLTQADSVETEPSVDAAAATSLGAAEHRAVMPDGVELFYRCWGEDRDTDRAVLLFHRGHEHSGRWAEVVERLGITDAKIFAWDARGHGNSPGVRGAAPGFGAMVADVDAFARHVCAAHGVSIANTVVVAHSVAAVVVSTWVHDYAPPIRGMVLATPAFRVKLYVPLALSALRIQLRFMGRDRAFCKSYVRSSMVTHDPDQVAAYDADPLISKQIAVNVLTEMTDTAKRIVADAGAITTPTLVLSAGRDWVVRNSPQRTFFERLGSTGKRHVTYNAMYHAIYHESERDQPIAETRRFIREAFVRPSINRSALLEIDRHESTLRKQAALTTPAAWWRRPWFAMNTLMLRTVAKLGRGVRIGWASGFDSGQSLDHVYRNRAEGVGPLGRLADRIYLDAPGWRGIRQRKVDVEALVDRAIDRTLGRGDDARVLDIAAGPGRYLLDVLDRRRDQPVTATLRDRDTGGLSEGRAIAVSMGLEDRATHKSGDAFERCELASVRPRPNVAIVSGLYELFGDNAKVLSSLRGLGELVEPGGHLVYTNQPWHPQLEMIARCLTNRDGEPWIMRCRSQAEMDALVDAAGFDKIEQRIDDAGIFTVCLAVRRGDS